MKRQSTLTEMEKAIQLLEKEQADKEIIMREQFFLAYESIKPINIFRSGVKEFFSSPPLIENALSITAGLFAGSVSKSFIAGSKNNVFRKLAGLVAQFGITNIVAKNTELHRIIGHFVNKNVDSEINKQKPNSEG